MTSEHPRSVLISRSDSDKFWRMGQELARAQVPNEILQAIRTSRLTAFAEGVQVASGESWWAILCAG